MSVFGVSGFRLGLRSSCERYLFYLIGRECNNFYKRVFKLEYLGKDMKVTKSKISLFFQFILIVLAWSSPFWLSWNFILVGIFVYYFQLVIFKEDFFTKRNFNTKERGEMTFYSFVLEKVGIKINRKSMQLISDYIFPWVILFIAYYWQVSLGNFFNLII